MRKIVVAFALAATVVVTGAALAGTSAGVPRSAVLLGANEVPSAGDPDGKGVASLRVNSGKKTVCVWFKVEGIANPTAAHIHTGAATVAGGVVVDFGMPAFVDGKWKTCVKVGDASGLTTALVRALIQNPTAYYVNVHNLDYPGGALRGQITKPGHKAPKPAKPDKPAKP